MSNFFLKVSLSFAKNTFFVDTLDFVNINVLILVNQKKKTSKWA